MNANVGVTLKVVLELRKIEEEKIMYVPNDMHTTAQRLWEYHDWADRTRIGLGKFARVNSRTLFIENKPS